MPIQRCRIKGKWGFRAGPTGKCFPYTTGNKASRDRARRKAEEQLRAMKASENRRKKK